MTPPGASRPRRARRIVFRVVILSVMAALAETCSYFSYRALNSGEFSFERVWAEQEKLLPDADGMSATSDAFRADIHPYLGFSYNPQWPGKLELEAVINEWGFTDPAGRSPVRRRGPGKVVIGVLGASVASIFAHHGADELTRLLQQSPQFSGKQIEIVSLSVGGFKQPQQLMALNYALALGAEFDIVLNIDGLNDIAWYKQDNAEAHVCTLYPLNWHWIVTKVPDPATRREVGKIAYLADERAAWASLFRKPVLSWSITAQLIWKLRDQSLATEMTATDLGLRTRQLDKLPFRARGPQAWFRDDRDMLEQLVANWERCSLVLDRTCKAHGIRYIHFLQPNQYVPNSKPLSASELAKAIKEDLPAQDLITQGYPMLRQAGKRLAAEGVKYHDLSMVFAGHKETFYVDDCCHFNRAGNEVLAAPIAQAILQTAEPPPAEKTASTARP